MKKSVIYIRTSTDEQNPELQLRDISTLTKNKNCEIVEEKQSAWKDDIKARPKFKAIYNEILKGEIEKLYVWDLDRLFRKRIKLKELFEVCKAYKCKIYSYRQSWLNQMNKIPSPWNEIILDLLINILGWLAEEESTKKSDRVKNAVRKKNNKAISYKGNKWGRPELEIDYTTKLRIQKDLQELSIRKVADKYNLKKNQVEKIKKELSENH